MKYKGFYCIIISFNNKVAQKQSHTTLADSKLKVLSPTLRQKKRFILAKIESNKQFEFKELSENLIEELITYLGVVDLGKSGIWILRDKFNAKEQTITIKVGTKFKDKLIGILSLISKIGITQVKIKTLKTSATLKGLKNN